jgi:hypothetical protein
MADVQFLSLAGSLVRSTANQAALANSVLHLFKSGFVPSPSNLLAEYTAQECDYASYAAITVVAWGAPILAPGSGWMTFAPLQTFLWATAGADVQNSVGGAYLVSATGDLLDVVIFENAKPMQGPGNSVQLIPSVTTPTGP